MPVGVKYGLGIPWLCASVSLLELDEDESEEEKVDNVRQRKATSAQLKKLKEVGHTLLLRI